MTRLGALRQRFSELYLSIDRGVLGAFRVGHGLVLLYDLARRAAVLALYYSNDGVLSNHYVMFRPQDAFQFSLLDAFSTPAEVRVAFFLIALVYALYTLGLFTRLSQVLALVSLTSLNGRNLFAEDGGVSTLIALGVWTLFMPVGDRWSLDALRREACWPLGAARLAWRRRLAQPFVSVAVLATSLQLIAIYWLNAAHKTGPTWRHGEAVHYVLWQRRVVTDLGHWLSLHEPAWLSPLASYGALAIEWGLPVLALAPFAWARVGALGLALALHGGIALLMTLGPFSYAMILLVFLRVPPEALAGLARRLPRPWRWRLLRRRAQAVSWLRSRSSLAPRRSLLSRRGPELERAWAQPLREAAVLALVYVALVDLGSHNRALPLHLGRPLWARSIIGHLRFVQRWNMFAPDAPVEDGAGVIDAVTASGQHIDPLTGEPPRFDVLEHGPLPHGSIPADYLFLMHLDATRPYRQELTRFIQQWHEQEGRSPTDRITRFELWWLSRASPRPGSADPGPIRQQRVFRGP